jgi:hypothetical protein
MAGRDKLVITRLRKIYASVGAPPYGTASIRTAIKSTLAPQRPLQWALETLREDTRGWWVDTLARDPDELKEGEEYGHIYAVPGTIAERKRPGS